MHLEKKMNFHFINVRSCLSNITLNADDLSVTSPTACRVSSGFLSALKHSSQGVISVTLCWVYTAGVASVLWASAAVRT